MTHHDWSETDFDWEGLSDACGIVRDTCVRWGRIFCHTKEKWGCLRAHVSFGYLSLTGLLYPAYAYSPLPRWLFRLDMDVIGPVLRFFFERPFVWWQKKVYNWAYQRALKKHPHLRDEILCDALCPELIEGGQEVHDKYWVHVEPAESGC